MALNVIVKCQDLWLFFVNAHVSDASLLASVGFYLAADTRAALKSAMQLFCSTSEQYQQSLCSIVVMSSVAVLP